eukprot:117062_1
MSSSNYSNRVTLIYASLYGFTFLATSIYAAFEVRYQQPIVSPGQRTPSKTPNPPKSQSNFFKTWAKSIWSKKKIYWAVIPHIIDQASDVGVILEYYEEWKAHDASDSYDAVNPMWFFYFAVFIVIFQRLASSTTIYFMTCGNLTAVFLQFVDLLIVKAVYINYRLGLDEPCNPQRYIALLEAIFEASPQVLLSMGYIVKTLADGNEVADIVFISTVFSLWSLTSKVISDDKVLFSTDSPFRNLNLKFKKRYTIHGTAKCCIQFHWQYILRAVFWRFLEISGRITMCALFWINIGGLGLLIVLGLEMCFLFVFCLIEKSPDAMGNLMFMSFGASNAYVQLFWLYRILSFYVYMIMVTIFATVRFEEHKVPSYDQRHEITLDTTIGMGLLIYAWSASCVWPITLICGILRIVDPTELASPRDLIQYLHIRQLDEARQLLQFGVKVKDSYRDNKGRSLLRIALEEYPKKVELIKDCFRANPKQSGHHHQGFTSMEYAAKNIIFHFIRYALTHGRNLSEMHQHLQTQILIYATKHSQSEFIKVLIKHDIDINAPMVGQWMLKGRFACDTNETALHVATKHSNVDMMRLLLENDVKNADPNIVCNGKTTLHIAVRNRNVDVTNVLVDYGVDMEAKDDLGITALHIAVDLDDLSLVDCLVGRGMDINICNHQGETALHTIAKRFVLDTGLQTMKHLIVTHHANILDGKFYHIAMQNNKDRIVLYLMRTHEIVWNDALRSAAKCCRSDFVLELLEKGADLSSLSVQLYEQLLFDAIKRRNLDLVKLVFAAENVDKQREYDRSLQVSVETQSFVIMEYLIQNGANIDVNDAEDRSLLYIAAKNSFDDGFIYLMEHNININVEVAFQIAMEFERIEVAKYLVNTGMDVDKTLCDEAQRNKITDIIVYLLQKGANINVLSAAMQETILMEAITADASDRVKCLLEHDVVTSDSSEIEAHALERAKQTGSAVVLRYLKAHGYNPMQYKEELLDCGVEKGQLDLARFAVENNVDFNKETGQFGQSPIMCAAENDHWDVVRYLERLGPYMNRADKETLARLRNPPKLSRYEQMQRRYSDEMVGPSQHLGPF